MYKYKNYKVMKTVKETIIDQLTENTGKHALDSGGDNGRMWQRNQGKDLEAEPVFELDASEGETIVTVSTFHYMANVLEFDDLTDELNEKLQSENDNLWVSELLGEGFFEANINDIENLSDVYNTYNWGAPITQDLVFCTFESEDNTYVVVQTHNGADIRGGYSKVVVYKLNEWQEGVFGSIIVFGKDDLDSSEGYFNEELKESEITLLFEY